jgi:hypothetical protein
MQVQEISDDFCSEARGEKESWQRYGDDEQRRIGAKGAEIVAVTSGELHHAGLRLHGV